MSDDYDVGYGKPPVHSQFKLGQSGNSKGRPKGSKNLKTDLQEELDEFVELKEAGNTITVRKRRAMIKSHVNKAMKGDARSANIIIALSHALLGQEEESKEDNGLSSEEQATYDAIVRQKQATSKGEAS